MARSLKASPRCYALIRKFEGCELRAYPDPGTRGEPWTVGYGHTGPEVRPGMTITVPEAEALLAADIEEAAKEVRRLCKGSDTNQHQFDALTSFQFNTGKLHVSTLLKRHRAGEHDAASREFHRWTYAGGKVLRGLVRRRAAEAALYDGQTTAE